MLYTPVFKTFIPPVDTGVKRIDESNLKKHKHISVLASHHGSHSLHLEISFFFPPKYWRREKSLYFNPEIKKLFLVLPPTPSEIGGLREKPLVVAALFYYITIKHLTGKNTAEFPKELTLVRESGE